MPATVSPNLYSGEIVTRGLIDNFVPNVWALEILRYRDKKFHLAAATKTISVIGKKGDKLYWPKVGRLGTRARVPGTPIEFQAQTPGKHEMTITQDREASFGLDDLVEMQSQYELRSEYTKAAADAHVRYLENFLLGLRAAIPTTNRIFRSTGTGAGTVAGDPAPLDNASVMAAMEILMIQDVPVEECRWILSPSQAMDLLNVDKFISRDYEMAQLAINRMSSGIIGTLHGLPVHVTTSIANNSLTGLIEEEGATGAPTPGVTGSAYLPDQEDVGTTITYLPQGKTGSETAQPFQTGMLVHPRWAILAKQKDVTVEQDRLITHQINAVVTRQVFGAKTFYPNEAVLIHSRGVA